MRPLALTLIPTLLFFHGHADTYLSAPIFPLYSALFLPPSNISQEDDHREYLATMESIRPILDVAMIDAYRYYLQGWAPGPETWLYIKEAPIKGCDDQKEAAWATLAAYQWTNGSGLDLAFGPACDYVLASVGRILGFFKVPMFTNAGFSEYFNQKSDFPVTRVGPLQDHIVRLFGQLANQLEWKRPHFLYEKSFWESEFLEGGFCKILGNGMYAYTVERRWNLTIKAQLLEPAEHENNSREHFKQVLMENIGNNFGESADIINDKDFREQNWVAGEELCARCSLIGCHLNCAKLTLRLLGGVFGSQDDVSVKSYLELKGSLESLGRGVELIHKTKPSGRALIIMKPAVACFGVLLS